MITIIDSGICNLKSVTNALVALDLPFNVAETASEIEKASALILPGVGAFEAGMAQLKKNKLVDPIRFHVKQHKPLLGICLGFQLLFESSEEHGAHEGLGILKGKVIQFPDVGEKIPHMGWNTLDVQKDPIGLYKNLGVNPYLYFVHSYCVTETPAVSTMTTYGVPFVSSVQEGAIFATQFHLEKSGEVGLQLLSNFFKAVL